MKKLMMIAVMAIFAMTASAQNINREVGSFTLQPKVGPEDWCSARYLGKCQER